MAEEHKKKTRKRNPEEQALWDEIESLKLTKREVGSVLATHISDLQAMENPDKDALADAASGIRYAGRQLTEVSAKISDAESQYKKLRG